MSEDAAFVSRSGIADVGGIPATAYILMGVTSDGDKTACGPGSYDATNLLPLYFLGGFVFYLFWEAKARYCFSYFVCLIPLAAYGAERVVSWLSAIRETRV